MMQLNLSTEHILTTIELWRAAYVHKAISLDGSVVQMKCPQEILSKFINVSRGWGDMMRASQPDKGEDDEFDDFFREILEFNSWAREELFRIERSLENEQSNQAIETQAIENLPMTTTLEGSPRILENIPELQLLNPEEQIIAERYAASSLAAAIRRDKEIAEQSSVIEQPADSFLTPHEEVSAENREWVRLADALQSLKSELYWAKKERLGIEQYLQHHVTGRVR